MNSSVRGKMSVSILMKVAAMHKSRQKQNWSAITAIALQILAICASAVFHSMACGQTAAPPKNSDASAIGPAAHFDHPDASFVDSLLKIGLYDIAIDTCQARFRICGDSQPEAASQWSILEMHSIAAKVAADPTIVDDPTSVSKLLQPNQQILDQNQESNRALWLRHQQQWCRWLVLRRLQAAYIAVPARTTIRQWSLATIRDCLQELETLQSKIQNAPARNGKPNGKFAPRPEQWSSLINETYLLQTDFLLLRVLYYPPKSTERIAAATEMLNAIEKAELRMSNDWPGMPNIELARCAALIHLERPTDALSKVTALNQKLTAPAEGNQKLGNRWQLRIASVAAEACRNLGDIKESNRWLESVGGWTIAPEIAIEHFANVVSTPVGKTTSESQLANSLKIKNEIGLRFGSYWQQRADAILLANNLFDSTAPATVPNSPSSTLKVELLRAEAKQLLAAKRWNDAIEKLKQAESSAASAGNETTALDIAIEASAVLFKTGQTDAAEGEFHRAAIAYSKQPKAPDAATMSVWSFDKAVRFDPNATLTPVEEAAELKQQIYRGRLMDIVNTWPNTQQANQAVAKLDRLFLATDQLPELLTLCSKRLDQAATVSGQSPTSNQWTDFDTALCRLVLVATATQDAWFDHSLYSSDAAKRARASLEELKSKLIERSDPDERVAVRSIMENILEPSRWPSQNANAGTGVEGLTPNSNRLSIQFLAQTISATTESKFDQSLEILNATKVDDTSKLALQWKVTELLFQRMLTSRNGKQVDQTSLANFRSSVKQLNSPERQTTNVLHAVIGPLQSTQLSRSLQLYDAANQCWSGQEAAGVQAIQRAIAAEPKSPWWNYRTARLFQTMKSQNEQAIRQFRQLASGYPTGSEPWLESRARTVQTMRQMGNAADAKKVSELVFATYPAASKEWRARFDREP